MQNTKKSLSRFIFASIIFAVLFTALRILLISFSYDFESGFFSNKLLATWYYVLVIAITVFFYFIKSKKAQEKCGIIDTVFSIVLALLFVLLTLLTSRQEVFTTPLEKAIKYIAFASGIMSSVHYMLYSFIKNKNVLSLTNIFPVIFFISESIVIFMNQSVQANTYNSFSNSIALVSLAFALLYEGKAMIETTEKRLASMRLITLMAVTQSVVPDIIFFIKKDFVLSFSDIVLTLIQFIYILYFLIKTFNTLASNSEDKI